MEEMIQFKCQRQCDHFIPFYLIFLLLLNEVDSVAPMRYWPTGNHRDPLPAAAAWLSLCCFTTATEEQQCDVVTIGRRQMARMGVEMSPVDYGSIVDRVVDVNRIVGQVHLFPHWSVV